MRCPSHCSQHQVRFMFGEHPRKPYNSECLVPSIKHGGRSVMIWAAISWYSAGPINTLSSQITASDYMDILGTHMHLKVQMLFPNNNAVFQEDIRPYTQLQVFGLGFRSMKMHFNIFPAQHNFQTKIPSNHCGQFHRIGWEADSIIHQATIGSSSWRVAHYSTRDYAQLTWVYSKKDSRCITGKWWPKSILIKKGVSFTNISIILSIPCMFDHRLL